MKLLVRVLIPLAVVILALVGCHSRELDVADHARTFANVAVQDVTFYSDSLKHNATYRVYLPTNLIGNGKLPVVYLLHGGGGGYRDWSNRSDVGLYASRGLILVMPEGAFSYWVNAALVPADRYEDFLLKDLPSDVERRYPTASDRDHRAIVGISMGGFGAVELAMRRPELFGFAGALSPAINAPAKRFGWMRWGQSLRLRKTFGGDGSATRRAVDPFVLVKTADLAETPYLYVTAGENEPLREPIERFVERLRQRGFAYEFHTKPGGHDWGEWNAQVPGCFEKLLERLK